MKKHFVSFLLVLSFLVSFGVSASANNTKLLALTFDDGPSKSVTPLLLDALAERGVKVTFFLVGTYIDYFPKTVERAFADGHQLANHSYSHPWYSKIGADATKKEISSVNTQLEKITGKTRFLARVPYGDMTDDVKKAVDAPIIQWSVDPANGNMGAPEASMTRNLIANARDGSIIILHDTNEKNLNVALAAIDELLLQGFEFVTLDELFRLRGVEPQNGVVYYNVPAGSSETRYDPALLNEHWAHDYINFVLDKGIMAGESTGFEPNHHMSRAMTATVLWRMAGCPSVSTPPPVFSDVPDGLWYSKAVNWAHSNGYISGINETTFAPKNDVTKEQLYAIIARYGAKQLSSAPITPAPAVYRDDVRISAWAKENVALLRNSGFASKNDPQIFRPLDYATRAEAAELISWLLRDCPHSSAVKMHLAPLPKAAA
ncbi:MAG: polysaccharide deacetylase family protein [Oscillospiraceae bacterium]